MGIVCKSEKSACDWKNGHDSSVNRPSMEWVQSARVRRVNVIEKTVMTAQSIGRQWNGYSLQEWEECMWLKKRAWCQCASRICIDQPYACHGRNYACHLWKFSWSLAIGQRSFKRLFYKRVEGIWERKRRGSSHTRTRVEWVTPKDYSTKE